MRDTNTHSAVNHWPRGHARVKLTLGMRERMGIKGRCSCVNVTRLTVQDGSSLLGLEHVRDPRRSLGALQHLGCCGQEQKVSKNQVQCVRSGEIHPSQGTRTEKKRRCRPRRGARRVGKGENGGAAARGAAAPGEEPGQWAENGAAAALSTVLADTDPQKGKMRPGPTVLTLRRRNRTLLCSPTSCFI